MNNTDPIHLQRSRRRLLRDPRLREFLADQYPIWHSYAAHRLRGIAPVQDAEDVVQTMVEKLIRKWDTISALSQQGLRPFAMKMLKDQVVTAIRVKNRDAGHRGDLEGGEPTRDPVDERRAEQLDLLTRALWQLRLDYPAWAEVIAQRQAGLLYPQIAANLSIATSTAKNHHSMGTRYLARLVETLKAADDGEPQREK